MRDGWPLRTVHWPTGQGSVLFLNGRGDFIEKYSEILHSFRDLGLAGVAFDWRGQGGSGRLLADPLKGHSPSFAVWIGDLDDQVAWFVANHPSPHYAVAHSMGAHLLLRWLEGRSGVFARVVLLSPMCGLLAAPVGPRMARWIARLACGLGFADSYAPGNGSLVQGLPGSLRQRRLTHDVDRYADEGWWLDADPALALGGVTNGWLRDAFASLDDALPEKVSTPVLVLVAEEDALVDNIATVAQVGRLPDTRLETIPKAAHELGRECDAVRLSVFGTIMAFLR